MTKTTLFLTGGLGNQLFQVAAGLSRTSSELALDWKLGNPRLNKYGVPDISDFVLPHQVQLKSNYKINKFFSKLSGYLLRTGMEATKTEKMLRTGRILRYVFGKILYCRYGHPVNVIQASDNGYFKMDQKSGNEYLIGYFQSYRWPSLDYVASELESLTLKKPSSELVNFIEEVREKETVMIHVRLGDYEVQDNFGILGPDYYESALKDLMHSRGFEKILLFSNEPDVAFSYIPEQFHDLIYVVPDFLGSAAETLEAMRYAKSYIIGNSTLSWWGARISYTVGARVIAPRPWFKSAVEPADLIPPGWMRKAGFHK